MIKTCHVTIPEDMHWKIKQKCHYYNVTIQSVMAFLLKEFSEGKFDDLLDFKKDEHK